MITQMGYKDEEVKALYWLFNKREPRARKYGDTIPEKRERNVTDQIDQKSNLSDEMTQE